MNGKELLRVISSAHLLMARAVAASPALCMTHHWVCNNNVLLLRSR